MIVPWVKKFAQNVVSNGHMGVCKTCCSLQNLKSGSPLMKRPTPVDRFSVVIPYASEEIMWEVIFNHNEPDHPPDFIFNCPEFEPDIEALPHLVNWDAREPMSLLFVLEELYAEFRKFQATKLEKFMRLQFEYTTLVPGVIPEEDVEVFILPPDARTKQNPVVFLIQIKPDFSKIPEHLVKDVEGPYIAILKVFFKSHESTRMMPSLLLSPKLQYLFGDRGKIPACPTGSCLMDYVPEVIHYLENKIDTLDSGLTKRKAYMDCLVAEFAKGIVEVDTNEYQTATILINYLDFNFIVHIAMPMYFPKEQPKIILRSVYHSDEMERPFSKIVRHYPWSPRWSSEEMVSRLKSYLQTVVPTFQKTSVMNGIALQPPPKPDDEPTV